MSEQILIQTRVDPQLKEQAAEVLDKIGIDISTGIRMFLKAVVREQRIPFSTAVGEPERPIRTDADVLTEFIRKKMVYDPPANSENEDVIVKLPLEYDGTVPKEMFIQLIEKVPAGKITRWEDMSNFLTKLYEMDVTPDSIEALPHIDSDGNDIPYWRVVSERGIIVDTRMMSREMRCERLIKEGVPLVQRGNMEGSYKVENFKEYLFNFNSLKVIENE